MSNYEIITHLFGESKERKSFQLIFEKYFGKFLYEDNFLMKEKVLVRQNISFCNRNVFVIFSGSVNEDVLSCFDDGKEDDREEDNHVNKLSEWTQIQKFWMRKEIAELIQSFGSNPQLFIEKFEYMYSELDRSQRLIILFEEIINSVLNSNKTQEIIILTRICECLFENKFIMNIFEKLLMNLNSFIINQLVIVTKFNSWSSFQNLSIFLARIKSLKEINFALDLTELNQIFTSPEDQFKKNLLEIFIRDFCYEYYLLTENNQNIITGLDGSQILSLIPHTEKFVLDSNYFQKEESKKLQFGFVEDFVNSKEKKLSFMKWSHENSDLNQEQNDLVKLFSQIFLQKVCKSSTHAKTFIKIHENSLTEFFGMNKQIWLKFLEKRISAPVAKWIFKKDFITNENFIQDEIMNTGNEHEIEEENEYNHFGFYMNLKISEINFQEFFDNLISGCQHNPTGLYFCLLNMKIQNIIPLSLLVSSLIKVIFIGDFGYKSQIIVLLQDIQMKYEQEIKRYEKVLKKKIKQIKKSENKTSKKKTLQTFYDFEEEEYEERNSFNSTLPTALKNFNICFQEYTIYKNTLFLSIYSLLQIYPDLLKSN